MRCLRTFFVDSNQRPLGYYGSGSGYLGCEGLKDAITWQRLGWLARWLVGWLVGELGGG
jgi:hypothetical protein